MFWNARRGNGCTCSGSKDRGCDRTPLCHAKAGKKVKVACVEGGRKLCSRMASMGIYPGAEVEIVCGGCGCPCLVRVSGATVSLGAGISDKIFVAAAG